MIDISLALGGGGSRGVAHVGVLRKLEQNGFRIRSLSGSSIGSIIGSLYASGKSPDEIQEILKNLDQTKLFGWPMSEGAGLLGIRGVIEFLKTNLGEIEFDQLKIPLAVVAVDLNSNREVIFTQGKVMDAVLGSIAVPGLFPPKLLNEYRLVDGGTLDPIPVGAARTLNPSLPVVAVSLLSPIDSPSHPMSIFSVSSISPLSKRIAKLHISQTLRIITDSIDIASRQLAELRLTIDKPDLIIRPEVQEVNLLDRVDIDKLTLLGEVAAEKALKNWSWKDTSNKSLKRRIFNIFKI